jgi:hypothetical protein
MTRVEYSWRERLEIVFYDLVVVVVELFTITL